MGKHNIYLCQVNHRFGDQVFLPYSVGIIQSYCQSFYEITSNFDFKGFLYLREDIKTVITKLECPKIIGISCYIWNWEYSITLAREVKYNYNDCLIVLGGPQVPLKSDKFFHEHPYIDILVHNEGEVAFYEILCEYLQKKTNYAKIDGLSVKSQNNQCIKTSSRKRNDNLNQFPSPYLQGVFDNLMSIPIKWNACHETNRGCPYSCTFCDWGSAVYTKLRSFHDERLVLELEWFGKNNIEVLYNCDANYGILKRDYYLTQKLAEVKREYGFPMQFRPAFAKNSNENVFQIAKVLQKSGLQKGVTLSVQSMDEKCLEIIKRKNIKTDNLSALINLYRRANIPTYTEIIMGLPGETYDSFKKGISQLFQSGQHEGCYIYMCEVLANSEMATSDYIETHGIKSVRMPIMLAYITPSDDGIIEYFDIVVETKQLPVEDWKKCFLFAWASQCFHCLNLTQYLAIYTQSEFGISYDVFYEHLLRFAQENPGTLIGQQFSFAQRVMDKTLNGNEINIVLPEFGQLTWYLEEATFLNTLVHKEEFYVEILKFISQFFSLKNINIEGHLLSDLLEYQKNMVVDPFSQQNNTIILRYDLNGYFKRIYYGEPVNLTKIINKLSFYKERDYRNDLEKYALEVVRYGRKSNMLHCKVKPINYFT